MQNRNTTRFLLAAALLAASAAVIAQSTEQHYRNPASYRPHSNDRPTPTKVEPGERPTDAPSDAIILFDGSNLDSFRNARNQPAGWKIADDGSLEVVPNAGDIFTKQEFSDVQLHLEFKTNPESPGRGQSRSNSGVKFAGLYEVQILDSYTNNPTYPDGMTGAVYSQYPPLVNATKQAGQWQTYDIIYRAPRFDDEGNLTHPASVTALLNGVLVLDNALVIGPTSTPGNRRLEYSAHGPASIMFQDHRDDPIWFRNMWIRELDPAKR